MPILAPVQDQESPTAMPAAGYRFRVTSVVGVTFRCRFAAAFN
jgi:hypothetical protein